MKTLILQSENNRVEVKADIFATNAQLQDPSFDTNFTAMEIVDNENSIVEGIDIVEVARTWKSIIDLCVELSLTLTVIDINDKQIPQTIIVDEGVIQTFLSLS